jgi:hypothetical protein
VTQTADGVWEQRTEYDWTAQRYVKEIHVGSDMHLIPEVDRVQILPGETVWITFQVDAERHISFEGMVKGVRGQTCVTNTHSSTIKSIEVREQVQVKVGNGWTAVANASATVSSSEALAPDAQRCLPYEIQFSADPQAEYRVVATISGESGQGASEVGSAFHLPPQFSAVEIDSRAWVNDGWGLACVNTFGADFSCMSTDHFPRDRILEAGANGRASVSFMVDIRNEGVCPETFVYTIDEPLYEGEFPDRTGDVRNVSGSLVVTTGRCEDLVACPKVDEWWAARLESHPQEMAALLPIALGAVDGRKTVTVWPALAHSIFLRVDDASNGIHELYAQLLTAKLNIKVGVDPRPIRDVRRAVDAFLATHHATDWQSLTASERAQVWEWAKKLEEFNERSCPPDGGGEGCTRTIGYWKNHAGFGPQPDVVTPLLPVWLGTAGGARSVHVTTTAAAVLLLDHSGNSSNGINKLYAQLLAAKLNIANGANGSAVTQTIAQVDIFLASHGSSDWSLLSATQRQQAIAWMETLDDYNNGRIGPGHCR